MIPAYKYSFKLAAKSKWPENVQHVLKALSIENHSTTITDFHFELSQYDKAIAFDRLYKLDDSFRDFQINKYTISSLLPQKSVPPALQDSLLSILKKVGRSIPFYKSLFFIAQNEWNKPLVDVETTESDIFRKELPRNGIILSNDWWISGRQQEISVMVLPEIVDNSLNVCEKAKTVVSRIGNVSRKSTIILVEKCETSTKYHLPINADNIFAQEFCDIATKLANNGDLELEIGNDSADRVTGFSRKRIIHNEIKDLNFHPINSESAKGQLLFSRRSKRNNFISLYFDFGSYSPQCSAWLRIQGPLWSYNLQFPYVNQINKDEISTPTEFGKSISNVKTILIHNNDLIKKIEKNHKKSPEWYDIYQG